MKRALTLLLLISIATSGSYSLTIPKKAEAQVGLGLAAIFGASSALSVPTESKTQGTKEAIFDGILNMIATAMIASLMSSITDWVNSGFEGKPAFAQNFKKELRTIEGDVIEDVLQEIELTDQSLEGVGSFICGPFSQEIRDAFKIQLAVSRGVDFKQHSQCTIDNILGEAGQTLEDFAGDFTKGGWPAWLELTQNPVNNRYGAYINIQKEIWRRQRANTNEQEKQLQYGGGFLSYVKKGECTFVGPYPEDWPTETDGTPKCPEGYRAPDQIQTPGKVIETQVNDALGFGSQKLLLADEFDELISALISQAIQQVLTGVGGLFGASNPEPGQTSLTDQLREESEQARQAAEDNQAQQDYDSAHDAAAAEARERARRIAELTSQIQDLQERLNDCQFELLILEVQVPRNEEAITRQQRLCERIRQELDAKQDELDALLADEIGAEPTNDCIEYGNNEPAEPAGRADTINAGSFTPRAGNELLQVRLPQAGKSFSKIIVELDLKVGQFDSSCPGTFGGGCYHAVMWAQRGPNYCKDEMVYFPIVGPKKQKIKLESHVNGGNQQAKRNMGVNPGQTYKARFEIGGGVTNVTLGNNTIGVAGPQRINIKNGAFIDFGQVKGTGPEVPSIGWNYRNIKIEMIP